MKKQALLIAVLFCVFQRLHAQYTPINEQNLEQIHVSTTGSDNNAGTSAAPFRTLKKAMSTALTKKRANIGTKVIIAAGTYREGTPTDSWAMTFNIQLAQSTAAPIVIEGAGWNAQNPKNTGDVILSGSEDMSKGWTKNTDGTWSKDWQYAFGVPPKSTTFGVSDAFLRREWVHINGKTVYHINPPNYTNINGTVGTTLDGDPSNPNNVNGGRLTADESCFWVKDAVITNGVVTTMGKITIKMAANTPANFDLNAQSNVVEVSTKGNFMQIWIDTQSPTPTNVVIRNLTFQHVGGQFPLLVQRQNNVLVEDCRFIKNKKNGFSLNPSLNAIVRRCDFSENGEYGASFNGVQNSLIDKCSFNRNSRQGEIVGYTGWSVCGVKFFTKNADNKNITLRHSEALDNRSTGFWWDTGNHDCLMIECVSLRNSSSGSFIEDNNNVNNNYEDAGTGMVGTTGIPNLENRHTVKVVRSIFAHNRPVPEALPYRTGKGRGLFFSENENSIIDGCLIYNNDVQIGTYDNVRAENRNLVFRNNLVAAQNANQRLYAVSSTWDSQETLSPKNANGTVIGTFKGGWYALFDGLSGTTNDNLYYSPSTTAFSARSQRWGTDKWTTQPALTALSLTLATWQTAHLNNTHNGFTDKTVDSRSRLITETYNDTKPLVGIEPLITSLAETTSTTDAFSVSRVSSVGYTNPLTVNYTVRSNAGDATNSIDFQTLTGVVTIPVGARSAVIALTPKTDGTTESTEKIALLLSTTDPNYVVANPLATVNLTDGVSTTLNIVPNSEGKKNDKVPNSEGKSIDIFPNPIKDSILSVKLIGFTPQENITVIITDMVGRVMYQKKQKADNLLEISQSYFKKGAYLLSVETSKGGKITKGFVAE
jgi:Right handed beta helix region/Secretion system C-terminal sorting domain